MRSCPEAGTDWVHVVTTPHEYLGTYLVAPAARIYVAVKSLLCINSIHFVPVSAAIADTPRIHPYLSLQWESGTVGESYL